MQFSLATVELVCWKQLEYRLTMPRTERLPRLRLGGDAPLSIFVLTLPQAVVSSFYPYAAHEGIVANAAYYDQLQLGIPCSSRSWFAQPR